MANSTGLIENDALDNKNLLFLPSNNRILRNENDAELSYVLDQKEVARFQYNKVIDKVEFTKQIQNLKNVEKNEIILTLLMLERQINKSSFEEQDKNDALRQVKTKRMELEDEGNLSVLQYVNANMKTALDKTPLAQALLQMAVDAERHIFDIDTDKQIIERLTNEGAFSDTLKAFEPLEQQIYLRMFGQQSSAYVNFEEFKNSKFIQKNFNTSNTAEIYKLFELQSKVAGELNPITRVVKEAKRYGMMAGSIDTYFGLNDIDVFEKMERQNYYKSLADDDKKNLKKAAIQLANLDSPLTKDECNVILQSGTVEQKNMLKPFAKLYNNDESRLSDTEFERVKEFISLSNPWSASGMNQRAGAIVNDLGDRLGNVLYSGQFNEFFSASKLSKQDFINYPVPILRSTSTPLASGNSSTVENFEVEEVAQQNREAYYDLIQKIPFKDNEEDYNQWKKSTAANEEQKKVPFEVLMMWHKDSEAHNHQSFFDTPAFTILAQGKKKTMLTQLVEKVNENGMYNDQKISSSEAKTLVKELKGEEGAWKDYLTTFEQSNDNAKKIIEKDLILGVQKMFKPYMNENQDSEINNDWSNFVEEIKKGAKDIFTNKGRLTGTILQSSILNSQLMTLSNNSKLTIRDLYNPTNDKVDAFLDTVQNFAQENVATKVARGALRKYIQKPSGDFLQARRLKGFMYLPQLRTVPENGSVNLPTWLEQEMENQIESNDDYDNSKTQLYSKDQAYKIYQSLLSRSADTFKNEVIFGPETNALQNIIADMGKSAFNNITKNESGRYLLNNAYTLLANNTLTQMAKELKKDLNGIDASQYSDLFYQTLLNNPIMKMVDGVLQPSEVTIQQIQDTFKELSGGNDKYFWNNERITQALKLATVKNEEGRMNADQNGDNTVTLQEAMEYYVDSLQETITPISDAIMKEIARHTMTNDEQQSLKASVDSLLNSMSIAKGTTLASAQYGTSFVEQLTDELSLKPTPPFSRRREDEEDESSRNPNLLLSRLKSVLQMSSNAIGLQVFENNGNFYIKNSENTNYDRLNTKEGLVTLLDTLGWKAAQFYASPRSAYYQAYASMALDTLSSYMPFGDPTKTWSFFQWWDDEITDNNGEKVRVPKGLSDTFKKTVVSAAGLAGFLASHGITALWLWDSYQSLSRPTYQVKEQYSIVQSQIVTARAEAEWTNSKWEQTVLRTLTQSEESLKGIKKAMRTHASLNAPLNESNSERLRDQRLMGDNVTGVVTNPFEMCFYGKDEWIRKLCLLPWSRFLSELNEFDGSVFVYDEVQNTKTNVAIGARGSKKSPITGVTPTNPRLKPVPRSSTNASSSSASPAPATTSSSTNASTLFVPQASAPSTNTTPSSNKELRREAISNEWSDYTEEVTGSYIKLVKVALKCRMGNSEGNNSDDFIDSHKAEFGLRHINDLKKIIRIEQ